MDTKEVQKLRDATGAGIMDCKRALEEANGDFDRALEIVREKGIIIAGKKGSRKTGAGLFETYIHNNRVGVLLEMRAETDFVVRAEPFRELVHEVVMQIAAMNPKDVDALLEQSYIKDESVSIGDLIKQTIGTMGENISVERFCRYEL